MRAHRFRLQRLRDLRRYREREVEIRFGAAAGAVAGIDRRLDQIDLARATNTVADLAGAAGRSASVDATAVLDADLLGNAGWFMRRLEQEKQQLLRDRQLRTAELAEVAAEYAEVAKARKVLDKLRERQEREHLREQRKAEQAAADELTGSRRVRARARSDERPASAADTAERG